MSYNVGKVIREVEEYGSCFHQDMERSTEVFLYFDKNGTYVDGDDFFSLISSEIIPFSEVIDYLYSIGYFDR